MILELAILNVTPGREAACEAAIGEARPLIAATLGFLSIEVRGCVETPSRYILLVGWSDLEAHTVGFRQSDRYPLWREKLHHFDAEPAVVEHYGRRSWMAEAHRRPVPAAGMALPGFGKG